MRKYYFHVPVQSTATVRVDAETVLQAVELLHNNKGSVIITKQGRDLDVKSARLIPDTETFKNGQTIEGLAKTQGSNETVKEA